MANHVRRQIREAFAAKVTGLATTGANVFSYRVDPLAIGSLPALTVRAESDTAERMEIGAPNTHTRRVITLVLTAVARATASVEDDLDQICKEVEVATAGDIDDLTLGGLAIDCTLLRTDLRLDGGGDQIIGVAEMQFEVTTNIREGVPDAVA